MKKSRIVSSIWLILILQSAILMAETFEIPGEGKFRHIIIDGKAQVSFVKFIPEMKPPGESGKNRPK